MQNKIDNPEINVRMHGIQLMETFIKSMPKGFEGIEYNFNINVETKIDKNKKIIVSVVNVEVKELHKDYILALISVGIGIEIMNFEDVIIDEGDSVNLIIPPQLDAIIKTISISTTRGVMFSELRGTYLHNAFLPIIFQLPPSVPIGNK